MNAKSALRSLLLAAALLLGLPALPTQAAAPAARGGTCLGAADNTACIEIVTTSAIIQYPELKQRISVAFTYRCYPTGAGSYSAQLDPAISMSGPTKVTCDGSFRSATADTVLASAVGPELVRATLGDQASSSASVTVMPALPNAVESMSLSKATTTTMVLSWTAPAPRTDMADHPHEDTTITGYKIGWTEAGTGRTWESAGSHYPLAASPLELTGLVPNTSYDVYVIPVNPTGDGAAKHRTLSTLPTTTPPGPPPAKKQAIWQSFNASPEPVVKGKALAVKGRLLVDSRALSAPVSVQFKASGATAYATIKKVSTRSDGWLSTTVTASSSGTWRAVYSGSSTVTSATSAGDGVRVVLPAPAPRSYASCSALNRVYAHGVGRTGATDATSGKKVTTFTVSTTVYNLNNGPHRSGTKTDYDLDRDNDGIACEK